MFQYPDNFSPAIRKASPLRKRTSTRACGDIPATSFAGDNDLFPVLHYESHARIGIGEDRAKVCMSEPGELGGVPKPGLTASSCTFLCGIRHPGDQSR